MNAINVSRPCRKKYLFVATMAVLAMLLLSACGGDPQVHQKADQGKVALDKAVVHARSIGVPETMLKPILRQETQLSSTSSPMGIFSDQPINDYYSNLSTRYHMLTVQVQGLEGQATQQLDYQATLDLRSFEDALSQRQSQGFIEAKTFADQLTQDQKLQGQAQYPKDYIQISSDAKSGAQALHLMGSAYDALISLRQTIQQLQASNLDTTALAMEEQSDLQQFRGATGPDDFTHVIDQINTQLQESVAYSAQAIPFVGAAKLKQFQSDIAQMQQYGQDVSTYQRSLTADQTALSEAKTLGDYLKVAAQIDTDTGSIQLPMLKSESTYLLKQFHQEVATWGKTHVYHDQYDGNSYALDYEYDQQGVGSDADDAVNGSQTVDDYQAAIDLINGDMLHLKAMEAEYSDTTPWNQVHATDTQLMQHYDLKTGQVIVVSLFDQAMRLYQDGKLIQSFQVVTGQFEKPTPPGYWHIFLRESPTTFKSSEPPGSAFWYPDTHINFAMEYHDNGYFFHDSWWRTYYGQGTNFPHYDPMGQTYAGTGSHGCINMQQDQAGWLYQHTGLGVPVIVY